MQIGQVESSARQEQAAGGLLAANVYRTLLVLIRDYGIDEVAAIASRVGETMVEKGDWAGGATWFRVATAALDLIRETPAPGEAVH